MGWASGSYLAEDVWKIVKPYIPDTDKKKAARKILDLFEHADADDPVVGKGTLYTTANSRK